MDVQETLSETIEAYLNGSLGQDERALFEEKLKSDESLQKAVQRHRSAAFAINYHRNQVVKTRLKSIDGEFTQVDHPRVHRVPVFRRIAVAASVLILIAAGMHFYAQRTYRPEVIAENLFVSSHHETFRGQEANAGSIDESFSLAEAKFNAGDYLQAKQIYLGILNEDSILKDQAEWNLTLCLFAIDSESNDFITALEKIRTDAGHDYHDQAQRLHDTMQGMPYRLVNR